MYSLSQSRIVRDNVTWPKIDGSPAEGVSEDIVYYRREIDDYPTVDPRFVVTSEWVLSDFSPLVPHSEGLPVGTYTLTHTATKRPPAVLKQQVDARFARELTEAFPDSANPALVIEATAALVQLQTGSITTEQQAKLDAFAAMDAAIGVMRARVAALYAAIDADEDYDITTGWT